MPLHSQLKMSEKWGLPPIGKQVKLSDTFYKGTFNAGIEDLKSTKTFEDLKSTNSILRDQINRDPMSQNRDLLPHSVFID